MADLLTHVLVVYALVTVLSWRLETIDERYVPVAMIGAIIPDLDRIWLLVPAEAVEAVLGSPFAYYPIHRLGGTLALVAVGALLFRVGARRRAFGFLLFGSLSQYPIDALVIRADGLTPPYLYPFTWWRAPSGNLFLSSDLGLAGPLIAIALAVWTLDRFVVADSTVTDTVSQATSDQ